MRGPLLCAVARGNDLLQMNQLKTVILLGALAGLLMLVGGAFGGRQGLEIGLAFAVVMNMGAYWFSDKMVLAMYHAKQVDETTQPELVSVVRDLATNAKIPMPKVYVIPSMNPNAFATGRSPQHAAVAATEGILRLLNRDELEGVMGHELTHVLHRDTLISAVAATIASTIGYLAMMARWGMIFGGFDRDRDDRGGSMIALLVTAIVMPLMATIIQLAISRSREYLADEGGARISGKPLALASALEKLERGAEVMPMDAAPATAHLFIVNPLSGQGMMRLLSTHPPTEERIARLKEMAAHGVGLTSGRIAS